MAVLLTLLDSFRGEITVTFNRLIKIITVSTAMIPTLLLNNKISDRQTIFPILE